MRGPIDFIVVGFEDAQFDGSVLAALADSIDKGVIKLIALAVVKKEADGSVKTADVTEVGDDFVVEFTQKYSVTSELVAEDDIAEVGDLLEPGEAAGVLVIEQLWAKPLKKALIEANGYLIAEGRIHPEAAQELESKEV
jgi:hypothetical protein